GAAAVTHAFPTRRSSDLAAGLETAIDLETDAGPQAVEHEGLVGFGEADFPRAAGMLQRGQGRRAGAAIIAGDGDVAGAGLGNARSEEHTSELQSRENLVC